LLGGGVDAEGTIRGIAVNIAARMEQAAPPGALRISQDTWRHVRGVFEFEAQPPLTVKGIEEPMLSYLVLRAKPRAFGRRHAVSRGLQPAWWGATPNCGVCSRPSNACSDGSNSRCCWSWPRRESARVA